MAKQVQLRGGTTSQHSSFTGVAREVTVDTDKDTIVVHDGSTAGGVPLAKASELPTLTSLSVTATAAELNILDGVTSTAAELNILDGVTSTAAELNILDGVTSTAAELNILDGVTSTAAELNILDGVTSTTAELNILDGVTATAAELNYTDGVTSAIQTQLGTKLNTGGTLATATINTLTSTTTTATTANITTVDLGNWTVTESTGVLYFATGGTNKMKLDSSGDLTVVGNITAYGTV